MLVTLLGIVILVSPVQSRNKPLSMLVTPGGENNARQHITGIKHIPPDAGNAVRDYHARQA